MDAFIDKWRIDYDDSISFTLEQLDDMREWATKLNINCFICLDYARFAQKKDLNLFILRWL